MVACQATFFGGFPTSLSNRILQELGKAFRDKTFIQLRSENTSYIWRHQYIVNRNQNFIEGNKNRLSAGHF